MDFGKQSVAIREETGGQIFTGLKKELQSMEELAVFYSPGIAQPCRLIAKDKKLAKTLTIKKNLVAVISDGSAVLGLGNIGPEASLPVMEGKSMLFKQFGAVDAVPVVLDTQDTEEIIKTVAMIAPTYGGINLEDISAPRCFEIEERLSEMLDIPVFHDDQHGTAICSLAALQNALKVVKKDKSEIKVVFSGAGAGGTAVAKLFKAWGVQNIVMLDSKGIITKDRENLNKYKEEFATEKSGNLSDAIVGADVFVGVSKANLLKAKDIKTMADDAIVFAMANPDPEILPDEARKGGAKIIATGRSDFPNQINNVLVFPGVFRGLLDAGIKKVTPEMKLAAAEALAGLVPDPTPERIIPYALEDGVANTIAQAIMRFK